MKDPFLHQDIVYRRLLTEYRKHNNLIIGLDFDQVIFDYHNEGLKFPKIISLIKECNELNFPVVIFSASPKDRYPFIREHCESIGIKIAGINEDVITWRPNPELDWSNAKIFYSILLDDRAGLESAYKTLKAVVKEVNLEKYNCSLC